jgi:hypothetical protein
VEHHDMTVDLERRLRAARPRAAVVDDEAFDGALLARLRREPIAARRRTVPLTVAGPVALGATLAASAALMLAGGPGDVGGPSSASAVGQALHWLSPPPGTVLHVRSVVRNGAHSTTMEYWQSADDPGAARTLVHDGAVYETAGDAVYDPASNTIYDGLPGAGPAGGGAGKGGPGGRSATVGDPIVQKVRMLLQDGRMEVAGREMRGGVDTWAISLRPDAGRPVWTLWVSAADGRPLELRDPGRDTSEEPQVIRWPTYEVQAGAGAARSATLTGAHPTARVVTDPAQALAAAQRLGLMQSKELPEGRGTRAARRGAGRGTRAARRGAGRSERLLVAGEATP